MKELIKEHIDKVAGEYKIKRIYLFGSAVRNDMNDSSDIDLVVAFDGKENLGDRFLSFMLDIQKKFNKKTDIITEKMLNQNPYFKKSVESEWEIIYGQ